MTGGHGSIERSPADKIGAFAGVSGRTVEKIAAVCEAAEEKPGKCDNRCRNPPEFGGRFPCLTFCNALFLLYFRGPLGSANDFSRLVALIVPRMVAVRKLYGKGIAEHRRTGAEYILSEIQWSLTLIGRRGNFLAHDLRIAPFGSARLDKGEGRNRAHLPSRPQSYRPSRPPKLPRESV